MGLVCPGLRPGPPRGRSWWAGPSRQQVHSDQSEHRAPVRSAEAPDARRLGVLCKPTGAARSPSIAGSAAVAGDRARGSPATGMPLVLDSGFPPSNLLFRPPVRQGCFRKGPKPDVDHVHHGIAGLTSAARHAARRRCLGRHLPRMPLAGRASQQEASFFVCDDAESGAGTAPGKRRNSPALPGYADLRPPKPFVA